MKKVMIVLGVVTVFISSLIMGCGKSGGEKNKELIGTYVNKDDSSEYFVLEEDGTYHYYHKKLGYDLTGEWKTDGKKLIVSYPNTGPMPPSTIRGNKIIGSDGSVHVKAKEKTPASLKEVKEINKEKATPPGKISKDISKISGNYIVEVVKKDGTIEKNPGTTIFRKDGKIVLCSPGSEFVVPNQKWEFKNGAVQLCSDDGSEPLKGRVDGNTIIFKIKEGELRYLKQD